MSPSEFGRSMPSASWRLTCALWGMIANSRSRIFMLRPIARSRFPKSTCSVPSGRAAATTALSSRATAAISGEVPLSSSSSWASTESVFAAVTMSPDHDIDEAAAAGVDDLRGIPAVERGSDLVAGEDHLLELDLADPARHRDPVADLAVDLDGDLTGRLDDC